MACASDSLHNLEGHFVVSPRLNTGNTSSHTGNCLVPTSGCSGSKPPHTHYRYKQGTCTWVGLEVCYAEPQNGLPPAFHVDVQHGWIGLQPLNECLPMLP